MIGPNSIVEHQHHPRLSLILTPYKGGGYSYEWQDEHGALYSSGYVPGTIGEARRQALLFAGFDSNPT